jgi:hypothetical protein
MKNPGRKVLMAQTIYYAVTGLWPLLHISSFMAVSGWKTDVWLVKTLSALIFCIALAFGTDLYYQRKNSLSIVVLAISCAIAFSVVDIYYVSAGVISQVYLIDAGLQLLFSGCWIACVKFRS